MANEYLAYQNLSNIKFRKKRRFYFDDLEEEQFTEDDGDFYED